MITVQWVELESRIQPIGTRLFFTEPSQWARGSLSESPASRSKRHFCASQPGTLLPRQLLLVLLSAQLCFFRRGLRNYYYHYYHYYYYYSTRSSLTVDDTRICEDEYRLRCSIDVTCWFIPGKIISVFPFSPRKYSGGESCWCRGAPQRGALAGASLKGQPGKVFPAAPR